MDQGEEFAEFAGAPLPDIDLPELGAGRHVRLVEAATQALRIPVIASVNATSPGEWERYATLLAQAGADAIELNLYAVAADPRVPAAEVEEAHLRAIAEVKAAIQVPLAVKVSPFYTSFAHFAARAVEAGADGLVVFNRFYGPDIDLQARTVTPTVSLSTSAALRLPLRWAGILRGHLPDTSLALTSGVHTAADVLKALLVGADVACTTAEVMAHGPGRVSELLTDLRSWMTEHEYDSVRQLRGSMSAASVPDPGAFERAQYRAIVTSHRR